MGEARQNQRSGEQVRGVIASWGVTSEGGDLAAQLALMTEDVVFLTAGNPPMFRAEFVAGFTKMMTVFRLGCHSEIWEITVAGDMAVVWNRLSVVITPRSGGAAIHRAGDTMTVLRLGTDGRWRISRDANMLAESVPKP